MQFRPLGESGIAASAVAFGAWAIGGWMWGGADEQDAERAIHAALDAGINFIDTAPAYGFGRSEEIVGQALAGRRDRVVLATKCGLVWDKEKGEFYFYSDDKHPVSDAGHATRRVYKCLSRASLQQECEQSLRRLQTDHIDLYQPHWQESATPIAETMDTLLKLKKQGKIRAIGICNASRDHIEQYRTVGPLDVVQNRYNLLDRAMDAEILPYCRQHGIAVLAYSPLELGLLTGAIGPDRQFNEGDLRRGRPRFAPDNIKKAAALLGEFQPIARQRKITLGQLAIAWTVAQPGLTHALVGARNPQQARENAAAGSVVLTAEELTLMETILARHRPGIV
jgi:methylglyoxal reductase